MYKTDEIIRAFKLCIKEYKEQQSHKIVECRYYEIIVSLLIREAKGEPIGLLKYFEDFLPSTCKDYFEFLYNTHNPVRNIIYWKY